jgi:hypothetical protein
VDGGWNLRWRQLDVRLTVSVFVFCVHVCESFASWSLAGKRDQGVCFYNGQESGDKTLGEVVDAPKYNRRAWRSSLMYRKDC